ncbi:MAG: radical SAM protein [Candidatus Helarchaeota archaeon]|nr:radical SAM protein [Candidatus Helarchaeota archaeon]
MNESNTIRKDFRKIQLKLALCYPNLYQVGIANYSIQLLYYLFNSFENIQCERFYYSPKTRPMSMESGQPLNNFDIICFSLQYELDYINVLEMLSLANITFQSKDRKFPLIVAGGPCALENPLPLSPFIDIFVLGDLEPISDIFVSALLDYKKGLKTLQDFREIPGLFIPQLYKGETISKLVAPDLDKCFHPTTQLISEGSPFGKCLFLEVSRGCPRGCRFCLIGYQGLPFRFRTLSTLKQIILDGMTASKVDKVSMIGNSLSDYPQLKELCEFIIEQGLQLSLPSLRLDALSDSLLALLKDADVKTITLAPEAGSERLRAVIGKALTDDLLLDQIKKCADAKIENLKLYFLINLPTETSADISGISDLLTQLVQKLYSPQHLHLSINPFIPKPHTPFQWEPPLDLPALQKTIKILQKQIRALKIYNSEILDPRWARIQGALSRGTQLLGEITLEALHNRGSLGAWRTSCKKFNYFLEEAQRFPPNLDEKLPWDFIDVKVDKKKLLSLYNKTHS